MIATARMEAIFPNWAKFSSALIFIFACQALVFAQDGESQKLRTGWYRWEPYQFEDDTTGREILTGLDIKLVQLIFENAGYELSYTEIGWPEHLKAIETGEKDIAAGATLNRKREAYAFFSKPYRYESNALFVKLGGKADRYFASAKALLESIRKDGLRVGVTKGYAYIDRDIREFVAKPENARFLLPAENDYASFQNLSAGKVDAVLCDQLAGSYLIWNYGWGDEINEAAVHLGTGPVRVMFSKKTTTPAMVLAFNRSLEELKSNGQYNHCVKTYFLPSLLNVTLDQGWFFIMNILGTIAFALSGILLARREGYDLVGAFILAALPAFGGGVLRDLLVNRHPMGLLQSPMFLVIVILMVFVGFFIYWLYDKFWAKESTENDHGPTFGNLLADKLVKITDALGLAAFTIVGVVVAVQTRSEPLWLWGPILAMLTGAGGGILRDVVRADSNNPSLKGSFYPEIALFWGLVFSLFINFEIARLQMNEIYLGVIIVFIATVLTRLWVVVFRVDSPLLKRVDRFRSREQGQAESNPPS